jgi:hypothetical protein
VSNCNTKTTTAKPELNIFPCWAEKNQVTQEKFSEFLKLKEEKLHMQPQRDYITYEKGFYVLNSNLLKKGL